MSDSSHMDSELREALVNRGHSDAQIAALTPQEKFDEYCEWNGLIRHGSTLRAVHIASGLSKPRDAGEDLSHAKGDLLYALANRGHSNEAILRLSPAEKFDEY